MRETDSSEHPLGLRLDSQIQLISVESQPVRLHCRSLFPPSLKSKTTNLLI